MEALNENASNNHATDRDSNESVWKVSPSPNVGNSTDDGSSAAKRKLPTSATSTDDELYEIIIKKTKNIVDGDSHEENATSSTIMEGKSKPIKVEVCTGEVSIIPGAAENVLPAKPGEIKYEENARSISAAEGTAAIVISIKTEPLEQENSSTEPGTSTATNADVRRTSSYENSTDEVSTTPGAAEKMLPANPEEIKCEENACSTSDVAGIAAILTSVKTEPVEQENSSTEPGTSTATNTDVRPAATVKREEATSTSRESCKYGIRCYRRNPMHRIEEAHPGDHDYKRPRFPAPPMGTPDCPYGDACYRRNPAHFEQYNHPPETDFEKNWKNYRSRLRQRRQRTHNATINDIEDSFDSDDYDMDDPFDDGDDDDYAPSGDDDDEEEYDECDMAEE